MSAEETKKNQERQALWNKRYRDEGHIWGDEPSITASLLAERLDAHSKLVEVGFGYGRDIIEMAQQGHQIMGVEESIEGLAEAVNQLGLKNRSSQTHFLLGEFTKAALAPEHFDAVYSHRVLHLLNDSALIRAFANRAAKILKPDALLYVSARNEQDFDPNQMKKNEDGTVEYTIPGREGHIISLWNEKKFTDVFDRQFYIERFIESSEMESQKNRDIASHFTLMVARKRRTPITIEIPEDQRLQIPLNVNRGRGAKVSPSKQPSAE